MQACVQMLHASCRDGATRLDVLTRLSARADTSQPPAGCWQSAVLHDCYSPRLAHWRGWQRVCVCRGREVGGGEGGWASERPATLQVRGHRLGIHPHTHTPETETEREKEREEDEWHSAGN